MLYSNVMMFFGMSLPVAKRGIEQKSGENEQFRWFVLKKPARWQRVPACLLAC